MAIWKSTVLPVRDQSPTKYGQPLATWKQRQLLGEVSKLRGNHRQAAGAPVTVCI